MDRKEHARLTNRTNVRERCFKKLLPLLVAGDGCGVGRRKGERTVFAFRFVQVSCPGKGGGPLC